MTTKAVTESGLAKRELGWLDAIEGYFAEMARIRKRMKATDERIHRADQAIRRSQDEIRTALRHAQAGR